MGAGAKVKTEGVELVAVVEDSVRGGGAVVLVVVLVVGVLETQV